MELPEALQERRMIWVFDRGLVSVDDLLCQLLFELDDLSESKIARIGNVFDNAGVERILSPVVLDDDRGFVERKSHSELEHHVWILAAHITDNNGGIVSILHDPLLDHSYLI